MQPNDTRSVSVPTRDNQPPAKKPDRDLAVSLMRQQIDHLYDDPTPAASAQPQALEDTYGQTHDETTPHEVNTEQWQQYHTAWQQYYQQYYERYYLTQVQARQERLAKSSPLSQITHHEFPHQDDTKIAAGEEVTRVKALNEIRGDLTSKIQSQARKVQGSKHFVPIISSLVVMSLFLFLQYNRLIIAQVKSYISPGTISAQNIIVDASSNVKVGPEPRIIIPKINVDAPVVYSVTSLAENTVQSALKNGVIHYPIPGASANPGEKGNAVFLGHSSNDVFDDGGYKFIFVQLEQMTVGDRFYLNFNSVRYTYTVTSTETILPNEVSKLVTTPTRPTATLVTCTPVGTAQKRFLVHAEQVSPDPDKAATATTSNPQSTQPTTITGNSPTLLDRLFGF